MISGPALYIALAAILTWYVGTATIDGAKWVYHHTIKPVVHVIEKPFHHG